MLTLVSEQNTACTALLHANAPHDCRILVVEKVLGAADAYQLISLLLSASVLFAAARAVLCCSGASGALHQAARARTALRLGRCVTRSFAHEPCDAHKP